MHTLENKKKAEKASDIHPIYSKGSLSLLLYKFRGERHAGKAPMAISSVERRRSVLYIYLLLGFFFLLLFYSFRYMYRYGGWALIQNQFLSDEYYTVE